MQLRIVSSKWTVSAFVFVGWLCVTFSEGRSLTLSKQCGDHACEKYEFCSKQDLICTACDKVCEKKSHNYNERACEEECQDYIHDYLVEYVRKCDLEKAINQIYALSVISLILLLILVTVVLGVSLHFLHKYRKQIINRNLEKKKYQQKLNSVQYSMNLCDNTSQKSETAIKTISQSVRENMPSTTTLTTQIDSPMPTNVTMLPTPKTSPLSPHEPCEDATLDYAAYVNQALTPSPVTSKV